MPDIPDEENMALPILEAAEAMTAFEIPEEKSELLPIVGMAYTPMSTGRHLPETQLATGQWYLDGIAEPLAKVHEALTLERGCIRVTWGTPASMALMPELSQFRHVIKVLALEATVAAEQQDAARAERIIDEMFHFDRVQQCNTILIAFLVRIACSAVTYNQVERTVNLCGLHEDALRRFEAKLVENEGDLDLQTAMMTERVMFLDLMRWMYAGAPGPFTTPVGTGGGLTPDSLYPLIPALPEMDLATGLAIFTDLVEAVDRADADAINGAKAAGARAAALPSLSANHCRILIPSLTRAVELWVRQIAQNRALRAALACERYRLATGDWPETLADLVPTYLDAVPLDPFDDKPIRYAHIDEGIKLWSIGEDFTDDGGDVKRLRRKRNERPTDWGWVLLNPDLRGRPAETDDE